MFESYIVCAIYIHQSINIIGSVHQLFTTTWIKWYDLSPQLKASQACYAHVADKLQSTNSRWQVHTYDLGGVFVTVSPLAKSDLWTEESCLISQVNSHGNMHIGPGEG